MHHTRLMKQGTKRTDQIEWQEIGLQDKVKEKKKKKEEVLKRMSDDASELLLPM